MREWYTTTENYAPEGEYGREWLKGLLADLADNGLMEVETRRGGDGDSEMVARLRR